MAVHRAHRALDDALAAREGVRRGRALARRQQPRIIFREILPNLVAPITIWATLLIPSNILFEAALSFLGLGVPIDYRVLGTRHCRTRPAGGLYKSAPWLMIFPGIFLVMTTLAFNLLGDGLRDALDPRTER